MSILVFPAHALGMWRQNTQLPLGFHSLILAWPWTKAKKCWMSEVGRELKAFWRTAGTQNQSLEGSLNLTHEILAAIAAASPGNLVAMCGLRTNRTYRVRLCLSMPTALPSFLTFGKFREGSLASLLLEFKDQCLGFGSCM